MVIAGNYPGVHLDPCFEQDEEIWVLNGKGATLPKYDRVFQMHLPVDWGGGWSQRWLRENTKVPVYMREVHSDIPKSVRYPFEQVFDMLARVTVKGQEIELFTSSITWAIALAILEEKSHIRLIGMELMDTEYEKQKDGLAFWTGFAAGRGISLEIDCCERIFKQPLYGSYPLQ